MAARSTTGCYTCKSRKKKCDETHPKCQRCTRSGLECGGYAPLESPDSKGVMRRAKIAPTLIVVEQPAAPAKSSQAGSSSSVPSRLRKVTFEEPPPTEVTSPTSNVPGSRNPRSNVDSSPNNQLELAVLPGRISAYLDTISSSVSDPNAPLQPITSNEFPADSQFIDPLPVDQFPLVNRQPPNAASTSNAASSSTSSSSRSISTRSSSICFRRFLVSPSLMTACRRLVSRTRTNCPPKSRMGRAGPLQI